MPADATTIASTIARTMAASLASPRKKASTVATSRMTAIGLASWLLPHPGYAVGCLAGAVAIGGKVVAIDSSNQNTEPWGTADLTPTRPPWA